jgi:hypothetical protein
MRDPKQGKRFRAADGAGFKPSVVRLDGHWRPSRSRVFLLVASMLVMAVGLAGGARSVAIATSTYVISGQVTDPDGQPVPDVSVTIFDNGDSDSGFQVRDLVTTNSSGHFSYDAFAAPFRLFFCSSDSTLSCSWLGGSAAAASSHEIDLNAAHPTATVTQTLTSSATVSGQITIDAPTPAPTGGPEDDDWRPDITLYAFNGYAGWSEFRSTNSGSLTRTSSSSLASWDYSIGQLPTGTYQVVESAGNNGYRADGHRVDVTLGSDNGGVDLQAKAPTGITGTVTSPDGSPVANVYVSAILEGNEEANQGWWSGITDAQGRYSIGGDESGIPALGRYKILFRPRDASYPPQWLGPVSNSATSPWVTLTSAADLHVDTVLQHPATVTGHVIDDRGRPVVGAQVDAYGSPSAGNSASTGPHGGFRIKGVPAGYLTLSARVRSHWLFNSSTKINVTEGQTLSKQRLILKTGGIITGTTAGTSVCAYRKTSTLGHWGPAKCGDRPLGTSTYRIGPLIAGRYAVKFTNSARYFHALRWFTKGRASGDATLVPVKTGRTVRSISNPAMPHGGTISGRVTDPLGNPIIGTVDAYEAGTNIVVGETNIAESGHYKLTGLATGKYDLYFKDASGCICWYQIAGWTSRWAYANAWYGTDAHHTHIAVTEGTTKTVPTAILESQ